MSNPNPKPGSLRQLIHDLNGQLFLIRGNLDLIHLQIKDTPLIGDNYEKIQEGLNEVEAISKKMRVRQQELEPS